LKFSKKEINLKIGLSLFWRILAVQLLFSLIAVILMHGIPETDKAVFVKYKPSVLYLGLAIALVASLYFLKNGLLHLVWGKRLGCSTAFWRKFTMSFACILLGLAGTNIAVAVAMSTESWLQYKIFVPLLSEMVFCFVLPIFINKAIELGYAEQPRDQTRPVEGL